MNKSRNIPTTDSKTPKRTMTTFVRKAAKLETEMKSPIFESSLKKGPGFIKKPNDSWDY